MTSIARILELHELAKKQCQRHLHKRFIYEKL